MRDDAVQVVILLVILHGNSGNSRHDDDYAVLGVQRREGSLEKTRDRR